MRFACSILIDAARLRQVVSNLVSNALKFSDQGAIFVRLRVCESKAPQAEPDEVKIEIEDQGIGKVAVLALQKLGLVCETARDGVEAVKQAQSRSFDLIFMDIRMPVMDGLEASLEIRRSEGKSADAAIIALTANAYEADRTRALQAGIHGYLAKPFRIDDLATESIRVLQAAKEGNLEQGCKPALKNAGEAAKQASDGPESSPDELSRPHKRISDRLYHDRLELLVRLAVAGSVGYTLMYVYNGSWRLVCCDLMAMGC